MSKCKTPYCQNALPPNGRMVYCANCRASMARWAKRKALDIHRRILQLYVAQHRLGHIKERKAETPKVKHG